jgi:hypothetical protein
VGATTVHPGTARFVQPPLAHAHRASSSGPRHAGNVTSPLVRGVVTAIRWMSPAGPFRQTNVALLDEGIRWVRAELDKPR